MQPRDIRHVTRPFAATVRPRPRRSGCGCVALEVFAEVGAHVDGVGADAVEEAGFAAPEERKADDVQPWHRHDSTVVDDLSAAVEDGTVEPGVGGAVTGRPDDGADAGQVNIGRRRSERGGSRAFGCGVVEAGLGGVGVDAVEQPVLLEVGVGGEVGERARALQSTAGDADDSAHHGDACCSEGVEVARSSVGGAGELR